MMKKLLIHTKTNAMRFSVGLLSVFILLLFAQDGFSQKIIIQGTVLEAGTENGIAGVTISTGKPSVGVGTTDGKGHFKVTVDKGAILTFTHVSFLPKEEVVNSATAKFNIELSPVENTMEAVVVQGFTTRTRETATGASTTISGKTLQDVPVSNVMELLQGRVAGVNIQNNTGSPGGMGTINVRGISSTNVSADGFLTPTSPLFVIDGVPVDVNSDFQYGFESGGPGISPLALIPPEDIEQVEFLKDAASTSLYGSRGTYGVVLVTTKRGQSKVPIVQYSGNVFINTPPKLREIEGGKNERLARINNILKYDTTSEAANALINSTPMLSDSLNPFYNNSTNWQDYFYRTNVNHQHNISILGGDQKFNYKTNLNYYDEQGIIENTGFKRYSLGMNALYAPTDEFKMIVNLTGSLGQKNNGSGIGLLQTGLATSAATTSLLPPPGLFSENNETLAASNIRNDNKTSNIAMSLDLQWEPVKGIRMQNVLSYNYISGTTDKFTPAFLNGGSSQSYSYSDITYTLYDRATINFVKTFNDESHNFSGYLFNEINSTGFRANAVQLNQTAGDQISGPLGYNYGASLGGTLDNIKDTRQHGYGAAFSYNYKRKYVIDLSYRLDGLSTNGPNQGYTNNPAISARWNFGKERIFDHNNWLDYGSVRGSWGRNIRPTGNIFDVFGRYQSAGQYNNSPTVNINYKNVPNTNFLPETQSQSNLGLDLGLFRGMFDISLDAYYKSIDNQVVSVDLADINGFSVLQANAISLVNYGFDYSVQYRVTRPANPVQSTLSLVGSINKSVLTRLPEGVRQLVTNVTEQNVSVPVIRRIGRNPLSNLLFNTEGVYATDGDVPVNIATGLPQQLGAGSNFFFRGGDPHWTDINGDYVIDDADLQPIGNPEPLMTGGISSRTQWRNFTLSVNVSYTIKRDLLNNSLSKRFQDYTHPTGGSALLPIDNYHYWVPIEGGNKDGHNVGTADAVYPNPFDFRRAQQLNAFRSNQTLFLEDGSYWKINNVVLAYNFDREKIEKYGMTSLRLTLSANNIYTFSHYSGPDPENVTALGRDNSDGYPNARSYSFGLSIQF